MVEGRRMRVRTVGVAGGAVGAGSCVRVTGTGSVVRMHESSLSRGAGGNVLAEMGGDASLQGCEVTAAVAGGGAQAIGCGSRVALRQCRVYANAGGGVGVADGALVSAHGSNIAGGMHASGEGSRLGLHACEVRGVVAPTAGVEVQAEGCEFEVKPKGSGAPGVKLELIDCRWTREESGAGGPSMRGAAQLDGRRLQPPMATVVAAINADAQFPAATAAGVGAVSAAGDARRHVFRVAEDGSGSGEGSGSVAGDAGPPRVGTLPAAYAADVAEAAQAEATLAPSAHARGTAADRRDNGGPRRRRYIFGPFSGGDRVGGVAPVAPAAGLPRGAPHHGEPFNPPNPTAPAVHLDGGSRVDVAPVATNGARGSPAPAPNVEGSTGAQVPGMVTLERSMGSMGSTTSTHSMAHTPEEGARPPAARSTVASTEQRGPGSGSSSSRAALRWLRVSGRARSGQQGTAVDAATAAPQPGPAAPPRTVVPVSVSEAAAAAAAAYVATAARRQASEAAARPADVRPLLLRNPDGRGRGREAAIADSRGGSTDFADSGAESAGPEERVSAVIRVTPSLDAASVVSGSGALDAETGGIGRRRSGLMRALQRVRRGRRQTPGAQESGPSPGSG